jgi:hypothetical protein
MVGELFVRIISSVEEQAPFVIVQRRVALDATGRPVTVDVLNDGVVIVAVPETKLHNPVPVVGALPAKVKDPVQFD